MWKKGVLPRNDGGPLRRVRGWALCLIGGFLLASNALPQAELVATRTLPSSVIAGTAFETRVVVSPPSEASVYAVEESVPVGSTVSGISENGSFDAANGLVKWGPFFDNAPRTLVYQVSLPAGASGVARFSGSVSIDGESVGIGGESEVAIDDSQSPPQKRYVDVAIFEVGFTGSYRFELRWNAVDGREYFVETKDLVVGEWRAYGTGPLVAFSSQMTFGIFDQHFSSGFFRVYWLDQ